MDVDLVTFGTVSSPITSFSLVRPTRTLCTDWVLQFELLHHFLLLIICGRIEIRTILDTFGDALITSLGCVFVSSFTTDRTRFVTLLISDSSRRIFVLLVTFCRQSSVNRLVSEHLLSYLSVLLQIVEEVCPPSKSLPAPFLGFSHLPE